LAGVDLGLGKESRTNLWPSFWRGRRASDGWRPATPRIYRSN